jgi:hypothetical protein
MVVTATVVSSCNTALAPSTGFFKASLRDSGKAVVAVNCASPVPYVVRTSGIGVARESNQLQTGYGGESLTTQERRDLSAGTVIVTIEF